MRRRNVIENAGIAGVLVSLTLTALTTRYGWVRLIAVGVLGLAVLSWWYPRKAPEPPRAVPVTGDDPGPLPAGRVPVVLPILGERVESATVTGWLAGVGDPVRRGDPLVQISMDKVDIELPAPTTGTVTAILAPAGLPVPTGSTIAVISTIG